MFHFLIESTDYVSIFIPIIVMVLVPSSLALADVLHRKVTQKQNGKLSEAAYHVRHNAYTFTGVIVATIFLSFIALLFPVLYLCDIQNGPTLNITIAVSCCMGFLAMLCVILLIAFKRWKITVSDGKLEFVPCFGKSKTFTWEDIKYIKSDGAANYRVYLKNYDKKAIVFNPRIMVGGSKFFEDLKNHGILLVGTYL